MVLIFGSLSVARYAPSVKSVPRRLASGHLPLCGDVIIRGWFSFGLRINSALVETPWGNLQFIEEIERGFKAKRHDDTRDADVTWPRDDHASLPQIDKAIYQACGIDKEHLKAHGNATGEAKGLALELACTFGGLSQRAAGQYYGGITCAAVGQQRRRLHARMASDVLLHRRFEQLITKLNV